MTKHLVRQLVVIFCVTALAMAGSACRSTKTTRPLSSNFSNERSASRAISQAKYIMGQRKLDLDYDLDSGEAHDKGDYWNVCFKPKPGRGWFSRCVEIKK